MHLCEDMIDNNKNLYAQNSSLLLKTRMKDNAWIRPSNFSKQAVLEKLSFMLCIDSSKINAVVSCFLSLLHWKKSS